MKKIALFPGSFSPAHTKHFEIVKILSQKLDKVQVIISAKDRDGISREQSLDVWKLYLTLLQNNNVKVYISDNPSPIDDVIQTIKDNPENYYYAVVGKDEDQRFQ